MPVGQEKMVHSPQPKQWIVKAGSDARADRGGDHQVGIIACVELALDDRVEPEVLLQANLPITAWTQAFRVGVLNGFVR